MRSFDGVSAAAPVVLSNVDQPPKVIMLTSSMPGEGKTTTAIALAQNFVGLGKKVLLVEGDIRRRVFKSHLSLMQEDGIISVVSGKMSLDQAVQTSPDIDADILVGEKASTNAADLFSSERFKALLEEARSYYDVVIIDTPPILIVPDARVIAQLVDAVIYVVQWNKTRRQQVLEGLRLMSEKDSQVVGVALSMVNPKGLEKYGYTSLYRKTAAAYYE